jgi:hypothetical protein
MTPTLFPALDGLLDRLRAAVPEATVELVDSVELAEDTEAAMPLVRVEAPRVLNRAEGTDSGKRRALDLQNAYRIELTVAAENGPGGIDATRTLGELGARVILSLHGWRREGGPLFAFAIAAGTPTMDGKKSVELAFNADFVLQCPNNEALS